MKITEKFLTEKGFYKHNSRIHRYRAQFIKYYDDVERSINLVSTEPFGIEEEYTKFDIWFWGYDPYINLYCDLDSHLQISTTEELEFLLNLLRDKK